jgi:hypothetical protein
MVTFLGAVRDWQTWLFLAAFASAAIGWLQALYWRDMAGIHERFADELKAIIDDHFGSFERRQREAAESLRQKRNAAVAKKREAHRWN